MHLGRVVIGGVRSIGAGGAPGLDLELSGGVNVLVGPNAAGKSSVLVALAWALDPVQFALAGTDRARGWPGDPTVTVTWRSGTGEPAGHGPASPPATVVMVNAGDGRRSGLADTADRVLAAARQAAGADTDAAVVAACHGVLADLPMNPDTLDQAIGMLDAAGLLVVVVAAATIATGADRTPWVVLIDQPETGLHPAAQARLATALNALARGDNVTVVCTSHSPFMVARTAETRVFELARLPSGATACVSVGDGGGPLADQLDSLFDDGTVPMLLDQWSAIPVTAVGIVVVEGDTDAAYLRLACERCGRPELLADIHIAVAHGTRRMVGDTLALRQVAGDRPLCVLVDNDDEGRAVAHVLTTRLGMRNKTEVVSVAVVFDDRWQGHHWDAEDLFPPDLLERFVADNGGDEVLRGKVRRPDGQWHWWLTTEAKALLPGWLAGHASPADLQRWLAMAVVLRRALGLGATDAGD